MSAITHQFFRRPAAGGDAFLPAAAGDQGAGRRIAAGGLRSS